MIDWSRVQTIFSDAIEMPASERTGFLDSTCGTTTALRHEVDRLLKAYDQGQTLFERISEDLSGARRKPMLAAGDRVAERYTIVRFLSRGGAGEVYEAYDGEVKEAMAVKVLYGAEFSDAATDRFRTEVRLARRIQSPRVCNVHDAVRTGMGARELLFLTMELIRGETLSAYLRSNGPMSWKAARPLIQDIVEGLSAAHALGILHCDLKPGNVMLTREGDAGFRAILTDFGLAQTLHAALPHGEGWFAGTPLYMAPEQFAGSGCTVATDVYALGVVVHEMLTGALPRNRTKQAPDEAGQVQLAEGLSRQQERAILKCLEPEPGSRHASVSRFFDELDGNASRRRNILLMGAAAGTACVLPLASERVRINLWLTGVSAGALAVMPFSAGTGEVQFIADGLGYGITDALSRVPGIVVIARGSAGKYPPSESRSYESIARELSVRTIVDGRVEQMKRGFRIGVQLVDVAGRQVIWSETYDLSPGELPKVTETVTQAAVHHLPVRLSPQALGRLAKSGTANAEAYRCYLLGRYYAEKRDGASLRESIQWYEKAIAGDPAYADAYASLAAAYNMIASKGVIERSEAFRLSGQTAARALELNPNHPEAHMVIGSNYQHFHWDWNQAVQHLRLAVESAPGSAVAHHWYAGMLSMLCRHQEALTEIETAKTLDPMSPSIATGWGAFLHRSGRSNDAVERLEWTLRRSPGFVNAEVILAGVYTSIGWMDEAVQTATSAVANSKRASFALSALSSAHARGGDREKAKEIIRELESRQPAGTASASDIANGYRDLGEFDTAFRWLTTAFERREAGLTVLKCEPANTVLRADPRYWDLVAKMQL